MKHCPLGHCNSFTLKLKFSSACCGSSFRLSGILQCLHCQGQAVQEYRGADKSLARPGRKQARKHLMNARDFNNIETRAVIVFFFLPARQGAEGNSRHSDRNFSLFPSWSGQGFISTPVLGLHECRFSYLVLRSY